MPVDGCAEVPHERMTSAAHGEGDRQDDHDDHEDEGE
jgi:hypothetical protein